ncbi:MAG: NAD(P)/FAD-dependent oxidoreductase [Hyphomicrobiaceae bacterium]
MKYDTIVLGAGMVGLGTALQLQRRGQSVALIDRRPAAEETSYGNTGIIQSEAVMPYSFPRNLGDIVSAAFNAKTESHLHWSALPHLAPWLYQYWRYGTPERVMQSAAAAHPLIEQCVPSHRKLIEEAGVGHLVRETGYLKLFRDGGKLAESTAASQQLKDRYDITYQALDRKGVSDIEPHLTGDFAGGILVDQPISLSDPSALGKAYAELFKQKGGDFLTADADTLEPVDGGWRVQNVNGAITAANAVIALGPWSGEILRRATGVKVPLQAKRGYHMHFGASGNAGLSRPVLDTDNGFCMTPMAGGIRLTTGAEFTRMHAPPTPIQLNRVEPIARTVFPLAERLEKKPWLGQRPCFPDMVPAIGAVPGHKGLWVNFGHHHLGLTLGAITGQLVAEMITGEAPFTDPTPYRIDRF